MYLCQWKYSKGIKLWNVGYVQHFWSVHGKNTQWHWHSPFYKGLVS